MKKHRFKTTFNKVLSTDKQRLATYLAYIGIVALSIFSSCLSIIFGTEHFDANRFVTNLSFNIAIAILGLILAWKDGELSNETRKTGPLYEIRIFFDKLVKIIVDTGAFRQWCDLFYEVKKKAYVMNLLSNMGIYDYDYLLISEADLITLKKEPLENIHYRYKAKDYVVSLDQITEVQYYNLLKLRKTPIRYEKLPFTFFLSRETIDEYQKYAREQEHNKREKVLALTYRIGSLVVLSAIIALSIINPTKASANQVLFDTIGRIAQLLLSLFMGYTIAHDEAKREIACLKYKCRVIQHYDNDCQTGVFVPRDRNQIIADKIKELRNKKITENNIDLNTNLETLGEEKKEEPEPLEEPEVVEIEMTQEEIDALQIKKED